MSDLASALHERKAIVDVPGRRSRGPAAAAGFVALMCCLPFAVHEYYVSLANLILVATVGALGLNILVGYTGQISVGHGAFMSVGAYAAANLAARLDWPCWVALPMGGAVAAAFGIVVGLPSLRVRGLYLAIATLAAQLIIEWIINHVPAISGAAHGTLEVARPSVFGVQLRTQAQLYWLLFPVTALAVLATSNLVRSRVGRAFIAIRDHEIAAEIMGINVYRYKLLAFAISSFYAGVTGVLYTYYLGVATYEQFQFVTSIDYLAMIIVGGLGSVLGSVLGAAFVTVLPVVIRLAMENWGTLLFAGMDINNVVPNLRLIVFGALIIGFLILEPEGLKRLWQSLRRRLER